MKIITLDCAGLDGKEALHSALAEALDFPEWYGQNLDALYDLLTEVEEPLQLQLIHFQDPGGFRETMEDAMAENPMVEILFE